LDKTLKIYHYYLKFFKMWRTPFFWQKNDDQKPTKASVRGGLAQINLLLRFADTTCQADWSLVWVLVKTLRSQQFWAFICKASCSVVRNYFTSCVAVCFYFSCYTEWSWLLVEEKVQYTKFWKKIRSEPNTLDHINWWLGSHQ
jgi:hypothetical protein